MADKSQATRKRLEKELESVQDTLDVKVECVDGDLFHWKGTIKGPDDSPYEGGKFVIDIRVPPEYPYTAPKMRFDTKIWHPNISSQTGFVCLDILKDQWSPALNLRTALLSVQALLLAPEPDDPQDNEVAQMYKNDQPLFNKTAKYWCETFASAQSLENKIKGITDMGFTVQQAKAALDRHNNDETMAVTSLLGG
eukprot:GHVL01040833.1.p1 GENE.GHVL01040833.1~~GHVL01040833.1.p1  ORF type:complete len:195 (-),score=43.72 GHVL01040833.1:49-633(-)